LSPKNALHMMVVRSPLPRATIDEIDLSAALEVPGVLAVLTARHLDRVPRIPIRVGPTARLQERLQPVLAIDQVRYVGEPIAVVLAASPSAASDAMSLVHVDMTSLPRNGRDTGETPSSSSDLVDEVEARFGPAAEIFAGADMIIESEFRTSRRTGLPLETRQLVAEWRSGELHIWGVTKFVEFTRRTLADFFDLSVSSVVCHRMDIGGMFGVRGEVYPEDFLVPWAARVMGHPVQWDEGRREHLLSINHAGEQHHLARMAIDDSGRLLALEDRVTLDLGAYARPIGSRLPHIIVETLPGPYDWAAVDLACRGFASNRTPVGTIRGPAAFETAFVRERLIDMAASRLGIEPLEIRRANLIRHESIPHRISFEGSNESIAYDSGDFPGSLAEFEDLVGWESLREERAKRQAAGEAVGLGWALTVIHSGLGKTESVALELDTSGTFILRTSAAEVGQGLDSTIAGLVHQHLGSPPEGVTVESGEAVEAVEGNGTFSSRSTIFVGGATLDAVQGMRKLATERAADLLGEPTSVIQLGLNGAVGPQDEVSWKELAPLRSVGQLRMPEPTFGFALHLAQVAVERETGEVVLEKLWVGYDCGRVMNPAGVIEQLTGGAVAGVSGALHERIVFEDDMPVSATLADYVLARAADVPLVRCYAFETAPSPGNPLGAKGAGEAGTIGAGAAVANAVADAVGEAGSAICELPVRPAAVFEVVDRWTTDRASA
ncbi:MAG TPA: xanthine dehydrogenase family protein molybdopterin-binding subunit, partial [Propionibacteriaceae bacterium]|nr:xanthine dehydrogenase family protein molybdopterin-binding subunit [Propionibacteriaceae bacterium]